MAIRSFKQFITETENSYAIAQSGVDSKSLHNKATLDLVNSRLSLATATPFITPYMGLGAVSKMLAYASIIIPQYVFMDKEAGELVFQVSHFGTPVGPDIHQNWGKPGDGTGLFVYFCYEMRTDGYYEIFALVVNQEDLDGLLETGMDKNDSADDESADDDESESLAESDEEALDELSKKTLGSYVKKAVTSTQHHTNDFADAYADKKWDKANGHYRKMDQREKGVSKAVDKLTSESLEERMVSSLEEAENFHPDIRKNWGYHDGRADRTAKKRPMWSPQHHTDKPHPFDKPYGEGYWKGYHGEPHSGSKYSPHTGKPVKESVDSKKTILRT